VRELSFNASNETFARIGEDVLPRASSSALRDERSVFVPVLLTPEDLGGILEVIVQQSWVVARRSPALHGCSSKLSTLRIFPRRKRYVLPSVRQTIPKKVRRWPFLVPCTPLR